MAKWQWCLVDDNDKLLNGWQKIGDFWYYLKANGVMATGWTQDTSNNKWYYLDTNGQMKTGWIKDNSLWYYLDNSGAMYSNGIYTIDGKSYTFKANGAWLDGSSYISEDCVNFVKVYEAFYSYAYYDGTGYTDSQLTIGYGTTKASVPEAFPNGTDSTITEEQACEYLKQEINKMANIIKVDLDSKGISLSQNEFDAICSFSYNCGESALLNSSLYRYICNGGRDASTIKNYFCMWSKAGGKTLQGLYKRRVAESNIFNCGTYDSSH